MPKQEVPSGNTNPSPEPEKAKPIACRKCRCEFGIGDRILLVVVEKDERGVPTLGYIHARC